MIKISFGDIDFLRQGLVVGWRHRDAGVVWRCWRDVRRQHECESCPAFTFADYLRLRRQRRKYARPVA